MHILPATAEDAPAILELQRLAYRSEAVLYDDFGIPPLTQTLGSLQQDIAGQTVLKAVRGGVLVGSVRALEQERICHVGRLIVHPDHQRQGIGTALMRAIESHFPNAAAFELFTGHRSAGNLRLYERLGYHAVRQEPVSASLTLIYLRKIRAE